MLYVPSCAVCATLDRAGVMAPLATAPSGGGDILQPWPASDGRTVYAAVVSADVQRTDVWRLGSDGTGLARVAPLALPNGVDAQPSASPDGRRLALLSTRGHVDTLALQLFDLATGRFTDTRARATRPVWSPVGDEVAYVVDGVLYALDASTLRVRAIGTRQPYDTGDGQLGWSPDGAWIVACLATPGRGLALIDARSGEVLPLAYTTSTNLCEAAWRPR